MPTTSGCTPAIRLHAVGRLRVDRGWSHTAHTHPFLQIMVIAAGRLRVQADDRVFLVRAGEVVAYPAGCRHAETAESACDFVYLGCSGLDLPLGVTTDRDGRLRRLAAWLAEDHATGAPSALPLLSALIACLERGADGGEPDFVRSVRALMLDRLAQPLGLADLARAAAMAPAHLGRRFKAATGRTPMAELRRLRLEAARDLVIGTALPLKAIADRCGFCDEHHLSRLFLAAFGRRPGALR